MARWAADGRERLIRAALELFSEEGYDRVSVSQIAERAGLARSSFFRHFPDKREVLFAEQHVLTDRLLKAGASFDASTPIVRRVRTVLLVMAESFPDVARAGAAQRSAVIVSTPALRERDSAKRDALAHALCAAIAAEGPRDTSVKAAAAITLLALDLALERWLADAHGSFAEIAIMALDDIAKCLPDILNA